MSARQKRAKPLVIERRNATFQVFEALKNNRRQRARRGLIFVEGVAAINCLLANRGAIETFVLDADREISVWARATAESANEVVHLQSGLMAELSDRETSSEVIAIARRPEHPIDDLKIKSLVLVFDRPASEGNLGSIIRTADAFGVDAIVTTGHGVDIFDPKTIRASIGTVFNRPVVHMEGPALDEWIARMRADDPGLTVVTTSGTRGAPLHTHVAAHSSILIVGNETHGVSRHLRESADAELTIPMRGFASSLNVSAATAILLYALAGGSVDEPG